MAKIEKTASGKYKARVYLGKDANGKPHHKQFTHSDKRILQSIVSEFELEHREYQDDETFSACLDKYIRQRDGIVSPSTIRGYKSMQNVLKTRYKSFCDMSLSSIGRNDLQKLINQMNRDDKSGKTIKNTHGLIGSVMRDNGYNPPKVSLPSGQPKISYEPSKEDIRATIEASRGTTMEIPILLGIHGLRRSEICALRYPDDFNGNTVHVRRAAVNGYKNILSEKRTKTDESDRIVPISQECIDLIKKQGYVTHMSLAAVTQAFPKLLARNGIPKYRFHDLRHFFASYMHDLKFSDAQIMKMGGWRTDRVMKNFYRYAMPDEEVTSKIENAMKELSR